MYIMMNLKEDPELPTRPLSYTVDPFKRTLHIPGLYTHSGDKALHCDLDFVEFFEEPVTDDAEIEKLIAEAKKRHGSNCTVIRVGSTVRQVLHYYSQEDNQWYIVVNNNQDKICSMIMAHAIDVENKKLEAYVYDESE